MEISQEQEVGGGEKNNVVIVLAPIWLKVYFSSNRVTVNL